MENVSPLCYQLELMGTGKKGGYCRVRQQCLYSAKSVGGFMGFSLLRNPKSSWKRNQMGLFSFGSVGLVQVRSCLTTPESLAMLDLFA